MTGAVARQGAMLAFEHVFALTGIMIGVTLPLVLVLRQSEHDDHPHSQPATAAPQARQALTNGVLEAEVEAVAGIE
jgi:hypothetical protein